MNVHEPVPRQTATYAMWAGFLAEYTTRCTDAGLSRKYPRFEMDGAATVTFSPADDPCASPTVLSCALLDASIEGIMIRTRKPVLEHTPLQISLRLGKEFISLEGQVQHCTPCPDSYKVGIKLHLAH